MLDLWLFVVVTTATCAAPGAGVLYTVTRALASRPSQAWQAPAGNATGVAVMSILSATGLGGIIAAQPVLFVGLQCIGAIVLLWMAFAAWRSEPIDWQAKDKEPSPKNNLSVFWGATLLQASNPMLIVFLLSLLPQFVSPTDTHFAERMTLLITLFVLICLIVHLCYGYAACFLGQRVRSRTFALWLQRISAVMFALLAGMVIWQIAAPHF